MRYIILRSGIYYSLVSDVQKHINDGWFTVGGVAFGDGHYLQAMGRYDE